jgi:hypothetical protein
VRETQRPPLRTARGAVRGALVHPVDIAVERSVRGRPLLIGEIDVPECSRKTLPLGALIVHVNAAHHWTRERIVAWVADPDVPQDESHAHHLMGHFR